MRMLSTEHVQKPIASASFFFRSSFVSFALIGRTMSQSGWKPTKNEKREVDQFLYLDWWLGWICAKSHNEVQNVGRHYRDCWLGIAPLWTSLLCNILQRIKRKFVLDNPHVSRFLAYTFKHFHSGLRIRFLDSPDAHACGRKANLQGKSCGFENIRIRLDGAKVTCTVSMHPSLTRGGPPRKIVPCFFTIILSSAMEGTYAPPAVHEPITTATWQAKRRLTLMNL